jgi:signal transduction histidine kinase
MNLAAVFAVCWIAFAMRTAYDSRIFTEWAGPRAAEGDAAFEASSVLDCLAEIEALVRDSWEPGIHFDFQVSPSLPNVACCGEDLKSAVMNLLLNARDAVPEGGVVSLAAAAIGDDNNATELVLRVADDGFGMTADTVLRATDPFFTTKTTGLGGLGLPLVKCFVQAAEGFLDIESAPGAGTTVTLRLPLLSAVGEGGVT